MNHSFNVEVATKYGVEQAILLENFYFWCAKNKANKKNMHDGKAYTYNTYEALAELFPYIKPRKLADIIRSMENEGLLISYQFFNYDRTKSYTLSDFALSFFEPSNVQKTDFPSYEKRTFKDTENVSSLNTDINTDVNTDINNIKPNTKKQRKNPKAILFERVDEYTDNQDLRDILKKYLQFKLSHCKGFNLDQWNIQLENLEKFSGGDNSKAIEKVRYSYSNGYQSLVYENEIKGFSQKRSAYDVACNHIKKDVDYSKDMNILPNGEIGF